MAAIQHINRNSDFSLLVQFTINGIPSPIPTYPWKFVFTTDTTHSFNRYVAYFDGETFHNCSPISDTEVLVVFERHNLGAGLLQMTLEVDIPSEIYPDGVLNVEIPSFSQIELWDKASDPIVPAPQIEAAIAYVIHGKGVPPGGKAGQVLKKKSDKDFDDEWGDDEGIKELAPGAVKRENLSQEVIDEIDSKPGRIVPAAGTNTTAEVFNAACQTDPEDANESKPGRYSHAENIDTFAGGEGSHAEGIGTRAMGYGAHAEGANTEVKGSAKFGHVGGNGSTVEAEAGFAHGVNAVSKNRGEAVFGKNNEPDTTGKSVFQVGIGPNKNNLKTGFQIDSDGTVWVINTNTGSRISLQSWLNDIQLKKIVVDQLPEAGAPSTVYLLRVTAPDESRHNFFEEYIYVDGVWEMLGTSDTDESIIERILSNPAFKVDSQQIADKAIQTKHLSDGCVTADAIQDGAIGNKKIASKTITHDKIADGAITYDLLAKDTKDVLGDIRADLNSEIQGRINGDQSIREHLYSIEDGLNRTVKTTKQNLTETQQEQAFENLGIKTVFVDSATEIGVALSEERANEIGSALRVVLDYPGIGRLVFSIGLSSAEDYEFYTCASPGYLYNARLNKKSRILRILTLSYLDSTAVKYYPQKLTEEQQEQAFENLGIKTVFVDYATEINRIASEERIAELSSATRLVMDVPKKGWMVFNLSYVNGGNEFMFINVQTESDMWCIIVNCITRAVSYTSRYFRGYAAVQYIKQQLTDTQKDNARANIRAQEELSVESKPNGDISIQGLGEAPVDLVPAERLAPYILKLIASADAPGGYTLEGTAEELEATARSIASNPHARVYLDCSSVTGIPTPIPMSIIMSDAEGGVVYLEADPYIYDGMIQYAGLSGLDISVIVTIGPELLQAIVRKSVSEEIKKRLFIDLWNEACEEYGTYNAETGYFELNGLTDITYNEAVHIYNAWSWGKSGHTFISIVSFDHIHIRTCIPVRSLIGSDNRDLKALCIGNGSMECVNIQIAASISSLYYSFSRCGKLRTIIGILKLNRNTMLTGAFDFCHALETVYINGLQQGISFAHSSKISLQSLMYMIDNSGATNNITITVHADVYAKLTGDTTNAAAAALTPEESAQWMALVETAAAKNITFATT